MDGSLTQTVGNGVYVGDSTAYYPSQWVYWPSEPATCVGKAHVFECDHVSKCKCGAITRVMPNAKKGK